MTAMICEVCSQPIRIGQLWVQLGTYMVGNGKGSQRVVKDHRDKDGNPGPCPPNAQEAFVGPVLHQETCLEQWMWGVSHAVTLYFRSRADGG